MKKKLLLLVVCVLVLSVMVFAEDVLIYEANFEKTDSKNVFWDGLVGDWEVYGGGLVGHDTTDQNTNAVQELDQVGEYTFIYEYKVTYDYSGGPWSPAAGLHFMCSNGYATNRGDSYLVFQDYGRMILYKATNDALAKVAEKDGHPAPDGGSSVVRVEYNAKTGDMDVYLNGELVIQWTDMDPIIDGAYLSVRPNMTAVTYDYIKVWVRK